MDTKKTKPTLINGNISLSKFKVNIPSKKQSSKVDAYLNTLLADSALEQGVLEEDSGDIREKRVTIEPLISNKGFITNDVRVFKNSPSNACPVTKTKIPNQAETTSSSSIDPVIKIVCRNIIQNSFVWSLLFGSVEELLEKFQRVRMESNMDYNEEITVVGSNIVSLVTVITLYFRGFKNLKLIAKMDTTHPTYNYSGIVDIEKDIASKLITKEGKDLHEEADFQETSSTRESLNRLFMHTYLTYKKIAENNHNVYKSGVKRVKLFKNNEDSKSSTEEKLGLDYLVEEQLVEAPIQASLLLNRENSSGLECLKYNTFCVSTEHFINSCW
eukprot:CAMPEP_0170514750 /NCGR_PEP_ID=MMETSP0209-20121228/1308_1 /TAXON_ID=665100 ORGANISM="Litonotus pictus, Strain P1" /NCGR_SAMPLE_ID=MMETSP0209 /ASSEMBLY_ACC=CAM_ASM_000301 /LENGTH=328 /DNA_ID=CAMNT_0010798961 /DNA_START=12 /DNA_END=995 /DNA_ORIENTATION=-